MATADLLPPAILPLVADPLRWHLLAELSRSDRRVGELTELTGKPQNLVSYHLGQLREGGLVSARRSSADRRDVYYRVDLARCRDLLTQASGALHPALQLAPPASTHPPSRRRPPRVLFLCTGNSARSQIAEALLVDRSGGAVEARSAGLRPKPLHPNAVRVLADRGIDITGNASKHLRRVARMRFDRAVTLCDKAREVCPELPGGVSAAHWSIPDPAAVDDDASDAAFDAVAAELESRVDVLIAELTAPTTGGTVHAR